MSLPTPEQIAAVVAREAYIAVHQDRAWAEMAWDDMGGSEPNEERARIETALWHVLRLYDEQVRADERARVSVVHSTLTDEQLLDELVRRGVLDRHEHLTHQAGSSYLEVRYATRWALDTGTDEERGRERLSQLSRRLGEPYLVRFLEGGTS